MLISGARSLKNTASRTHILQRTKFILKFTPACGGW